MLEYIKFRLDAYKEKRAIKRDLRRVKVEGELERLRTEVSRETIKFISNKEDYNPEIEEHEAMDMTKYPTITKLVVDKYVKMVVRGHIYIRDVPIQYRGEVKDILEVIGLIDETSHNKSHNVPTVEEVSPHVKDTDYITTRCIDILGIITKDTFAEDVEFYLYDCLDLQNTQVNIIAVKGLTSKQVLYIDERGDLYYNDKRFSLIAVIKDHLDSTKVGANGGFIKNSFNFEGVGIYVCYDEYAEGTKHNIVIDATVLKYGKATKVRTPFKESKRYHNEIINYGGAIISLSYPRGDIDDSIYVSYNIGSFYYSSFSGMVVDVLNLQNIIGSRRVEYSLANTYIYEYAGIVIKYNNDESGTIRISSNVKVIVLGRN